MHLRRITLLVAAALACSTTTAGTASAHRAIPSPPTVTAAWAVGWSLRATISCPTRCVTTTRLRAGGRAIGRLGTRHLAEGETRTVVLHPSRGARSAIARALGARRRVEAVMTVRADGHRPVVTRTRLQ